jgi:hypothetical protein
MNEPAKLRVAFLPHASAKVIVEIYEDGTVRRIKRPKSTAAMDDRRKRYADRWRGIWGGRMLLGSRSLAT